MQSLIEQWIVHRPLVLEVLGSISTQDEKFSGSEHILLASLAGIMLIQ